MQFSWAFGAQRFHGEQRVSIVCRLSIRHGPFPFLLLSLWVITESAFMQKGRGRVSPPGLLANLRDLMIIINRGFVQGRRGDWLSSGGIARTLKWRSLYFCWECGATKGSLFRRESGSEYISFAFFVNRQEFLLSNFVHSASYFQILFSHKMALVTLSYKKTCTYNLTICVWLWYDLGLLG